MSYDWGSSPRRRKRLLWGQLLLWLIFICPAVYTQEEVVWQGRLLSNWGSRSYGLRIEIFDVSHSAQLAKLSDYRQAVDAREFKGFIESRVLGSLQITGGGKIVVPINAIVKKRTTTGWRYLLVTRNLLVEPGSSRVSSMSSFGPGAASRAGLNSAEKDRFITIVLDLDERLAGNGNLYENANLEFSNEDITIISSTSIPKRVIELRTEEQFRAGAENGSLTITSGAHLAKALQEAAAKFRAKDESPAARAYQAEEMYLDLDVMNFETTIEKIVKLSVLGTITSRQRNALAYARYRLHQFDEAQRLLEDLIRDDPGDLQAYTLLSCLLDQGGRREEAARISTAFENRIESWFADSANPTNEEKELVKKIIPQAGLPAYILGLRSIQEADYKAAKEWLLRARRFGYYPTDCWILRVFIEYERKAWPEVLWMIWQGAEYGEANLSEKSKSRLSSIKGGVSDKVPAEIKWMEGIALEHMGKSEEGFAALKAAEIQKPFDPEILKPLAMRYWRSGQREAALALWRRWAALYPQDGRARDVLRAALDGNPLNETLEGLSRSGDFLKDLNVRYPHSFRSDSLKIADQVNRSALKMVGEGKAEAAAMRLRSFAEIYELSPTIYYNLALMEKNFGHDLDALRWALKAVELKPNYKEAYDLAGNVFLQLGDCAASVRFYSRALEIDRGDPLSQYNLGCAFWCEQDLVNAEKCWLAALREDKSRAFARNEDRSDVTRIELDIDVEPVSAMAQRSMGYLFIKRGDTEQALDMFVSLIKSNPAAPQPYFEVGKLLLEKKQEQEAETYFQQYVSRGGDEAKVRALTKK